MYNVTEYQYQQLKNYYPNCSVVAEIGRQPLKEESPNTDVQQLQAKIRAVADKLFVCHFQSGSGGLENLALINELRELSAVLGLLW